MFTNDQYYSFMFCIDLLAYLIRGFEKYKNVVTGKSIKGPTPSFIPCHKDASGRDRSGTGQLLFGALL